MKLSESAQEQLEWLWVTTQEQEGGDAAPASTDFAELENCGLVEQRNRRPSLTHAGWIEAAAAIRRHRLAERLMADVLLTQEALLDEQACRLEHALFDGVDESICTLLGHPKFCPHGRPIPPGECCRQMRESVGRLIAPLSQLQPQQGGTIAYIQMDHPRRLEKLMAMGVLPGAPIVCLRRSPSYVFETGFSQFAVDEDIAGSIYVRLRQSK